MPNINLCKGRLQRPTYRPFILQVTCLLNKWSSKICAPIMYTHDVIFLMGSVHIADM